ncbi:MAG: hypothetical protein PHN44_01275 [Candidatus Marinimicrobia bacterium]|nr:hypothetical protein [Candidatus Neomarinimicrobiota bacterium]MDD5539074.1 hypothetical protein [Candidatus Neomarinimicrobiota bacterium]
MNKIETILDRDEHFKVTPHVRSGCEWVFTGDGIATEKLDGTNVRLTISSGKIVKVEKRCNPTREEKMSGGEPGYIDAHETDPSDKHIFRAVAGTDVSKIPDGSYSCEAVGPKIQGNPLGLISPTCYFFTLNPTIILNAPRTYDGLKKLFENFDSLYSPGHKAEGIVFHHPDGRMAKIKVKDF